MFAKSYLPLCLDITQHTSLYTVQNYDYNCVGVIASISYSIIYCIVHGHYGLFCPWPVRHCCHLPSIFLALKTLLISLSSHLYTCPNPRNYLCCIVSSNEIKFNCSSHTFPIILYFPVFP